jgi:signal transduction histidine kinase
MDHFLEINLYRISIELINNTIKYANASEINLTINKNNSIVELDYSDNGVGFEMVEVKRGLGLGNIKSRVESMKGLMQYQSKINQGVAVHIEIELNNRIEI